MKSKLLLTSMAALFTSVAGANAVEYHPFVGAAMGIQGIIYTDEADDAAKLANIDLPEDPVAFGIEAGMRFGEHDKIYNYGFTISADTSASEDVEEKFGSAKLGDFRTTQYSVMYDNYIRVSGDKLKRIDLVLGAGLGTMNYDFDWKDSAMQDETVWSPDLAFKIGVDFELNKHLTVSANTRVFVPTRSHYAAESTYIVGGAIKYLF